MVMSNSISMHQAKKHSLTSLKTTADSNANRDKRWDINGRVLIGLDGAMEQQ